MLPVASITKGGEKKKATNPDAYRRIHVQDVILHKRESGLVVVAQQAHLDKVRVQRRQRVWRRTQCLNRSLQWTNGQLRLHT